MAPLVIDHPGADAAPGPLAAFLADVANAGAIAVPVESLGGDPDALWALAGDAEAAGLVDRWPDAEGGPSVVLTPWSAASLGLTPSDDGSRWLRPGEREPSRYARTRVGVFEVEENTSVDDRALPADEVLVAAEDLERSRRAALDQLAGPAPAARRLTLAELGERMRTGDVPTLDRDDLGRRAASDPRMLHFEGSGPMWPIPPTPAGACGACGARTLGIQTYCLWCDRSGADHLIRPGALVPEPVRKPRQAGRAVAAKAGPGLRGGIG